MKTATQEITTERDRLAAEILEYHRMMANMSEQNEREREDMMREMEEKRLCLSR